MKQKVLVAIIIVIIILLFVIGGTFAYVILSNKNADKVKHPVRPITNPESTEVKNATTLLNLLDANATTIKEATEEIDKLETRQDVVSGELERITSELEYAKQNIRTLYDQQQGINPQIFEQKIQSKNKQLTQNKLALDDLYSSKILIEKQYNQSKRSPNKSRFALLVKEINEQIIFVNSQRQTLQNELNAYMERSKLHSVEHTKNIAAQRTLLQDEKTLTSEKEKLLEWQLQMSKRIEMLKDSILNAEAELAKNQAEYEQNYI